MTLLTDGDAAEHRHSLPPVPSLKRSYPYNDHTDELVEVTIYLENAVAECDGCGQLFVSRKRDDGWAGGVYWVPLRWWHRKARRKLARKTGVGRPTSEERWNGAPLVTDDEPPPRSPRNPDPRLWPGVERG